MERWETSRLIRRNTRCQAPIIVISANAFTDDRERSIAADCDDYVTKPINPEEVLARVASHLRTARILQAARAASKPVSLSLDDAPAHAKLSARFQLTEREVQVLRWVACGKTNRDIGDILGLSPRTVNKHLEHVYVKLGVETRTAATSVALAAMSERA